MKEVTLIAIGDSGSGKSSFGNMYLQKQIFDVSDSADPCTRNPVFGMNEIGGLIRRFCDTEGHCDGNSVNSQQIQKLATYLGEKNPQVNGIVIVLNGQCPRFSQGVKDLIKFAYKSFGGEKILAHISVVFTRCFAVLPKIPDRTKLNKEYKAHIMNYISEISGIQDVPDVPVFFADCDDPDGDETKSNLIQFHGWAVSRTTITLNPKSIRPPDDIVEEKQNFTKGYVIENDIKYSIIEKKKRNKIIPNNKEAVRYTEWVTYDTYKEPIEKYQKERRNVDGGYVYRGNYRYKEIRTEERVNTIDIKTNKVTNGYWYFVSKKENDAGKKRFGKEIKTVKNRGKDGKHDESWWAFGLNHHTHYRIYEVTYKMERDFVIDYDGNKSYISDWKTIPNSRVETTIKRDKERGYSNFYENEVSSTISTVYTNT